MTEQADPTAQAPHARVQAAHDFLAQCATEPDAAVLAASFAQAIGVFGFGYCAGGAWAGAGAARVHRFYFNTWPQDWLEEYQANQYFADDPMLIETRRRTTPFLSSQMAETATFTSEGAKVVAAAAAYGWAEVMAVPIHGPFSYQGLVTMASLAPAPVSAVDIALLRAMALAVHERAQASVGFGQSTQSPVELSPREKDVMRWVAAGKTDAEIAIILGIAAATAHYHVERVKTRLDTRSRSEAVAMLVLAGSI